MAVRTGARENPESAIQITPLHVRSLPRATDSTQSYRREARRLRHELRYQPLELHRSLCSLALSQNSAQNQSQNHLTGLGTWDRESRVDHVQELVAGVVERMEGPLLRYPARLALLKQAERAGMRQFDANLIITAVQHRMGERIVRRPRVAKPWMRHLAVAAIFQCWIIGALWWLLA